MIETAIKLANITFSYDAEEPQLKNLSLEIEKGECVLVTGASGCGKTTLTRLINGLIPHYYEGELTGELHLNGKNARELEEWEYGQQVGSVFQDARSQFFTSNVLDELAFASENYGLEAERINRRIEAVMKQNQIDYLKKRKLAQLSSGEKQKVAMGAVQVHSPEIFVLDEPSANLDNQGNAQLAATVKQLKQAGKTILIADHRIHYLMEVVDRVVYLAKGEVKAQWTIDEFRQLSKTALHSFDIREKQEVYISELLREENRDTAFLALQNLTIGYHRLAPSLIKDLNLTLAKGEIVLITGENGLGKTTLARTLCGLNKEQAGSISINGQLQTAKKRRKKCWFVLQDADYQLFSDSVLNELLLGTKKIEENLVKAERLLKELNLWKYKDQHPATLSGGQKQRLVFAVGLMREPELLILDEPTSGLDAGNMRRVQRMIVDYANKGITFVIITHDLEFAKGFGRRTIQLEKAASSKLQPSDLAVFK
ncbi:energy-coupling factor ABC transporter ATP-binding protein [Enterococcus hulanensis]|uniref:Energy-coupling factor ABC transporter ATP-binding protein n=1 Tax=Enterococcus hulanensis TaxID=2559929 RepID=A0ABU3F3H3_9ENTE|nr:energy-coupling factor ABC transporter ATP-binding protein [Enterococcus hulanensis]MDT2601672.1 energy-coupling factor ABC transporter ATP-binding protein [Enterococcus hulanensis]MDT2609186.1 energy-coupling factor ABC transporter ATP-binding protein [Enterococcus hulanensis]MDT2616773.1 energy-coupling factor ABC transporter ATP-binding protein [Enterococcus hulanensis]MDT2629516.1 energy-coupling factor ABC transporter ATP-binding protein [Enterococcus hulanensis]MDT2657169.1 energy-cou